MSGTFVTITVLMLGTAPLTGLFFGEIFRPYGCELSACSIATLIHTLLVLGILGSAIDQGAE